MWMLKARQAFAGIVLASAIGCTSASAGVEITQRCNFWEAFRGTLDGQTAAGVTTKMSDGSLVSVIVTSEDISLRLSGRHWDLETGDDARIRIVVDGNGFRGKAHAVNDQEFEVSNLPNDFLESLIDGREAYIEINGVRWRLDLNGLTRCLKSSVEPYARRRNR